LAQKIIPIAILFNPIAKQIIERIIYFVSNFIGHLQTGKRVFLKTYPPVHRHGLTPLPLMSARNYRIG